MLPLLALIAGGAVALLAGSGGGSSPSAPVKLQTIRVAPPRLPARLRRLRAIVRAKKPDPLPTVQAELVALKAELARILAQKAAAVAHRPAPDSDPDVIAKWAKDHGENGNELRAVYPEWGWWRNRDSHHETAWRAQFKLPKGRGAVEWWVQNDGSFGYHHVWGGFDLWKSISDVAGDLEDATKWLSDHLSHVDWATIADAIETAASFVPVLGTAVSDIVATAQVVIEELSSGDPLEKGIRAAYDYALASLPGGASLHGMLDPVLDAIIKVALKHEKVARAVIEEITASVPDSPSLEGVSPRSIVASLLTIVVHALGVET